MSPDPVPPDAWAAEGRRVASALQDVAAAVITGSDASAAAEVALAIAAAHSHERRVAIADLVGVEQLTPLADAPGLLECLRDGESVSDIARPLNADGSIFALPAGRGPIAERWVLESARWDRLVGGFREVDALLLIVTLPAAPGLETLIGRVDGVVAVDLPPSLVRQWPLLATVDRPEPELPPIAGTPLPGTLPSRTQRRRSRLLRAGGAVALVALGAVAFVAWRVTRAPQEVATISEGSGPGDASSRAAVVAQTRPAAVHIDLGEIVNPDDSAHAAAFAVELVAVNTLASANSRIAALGDPAPAATVAPVVLGGGGRTWYRVLVGAWESRAAAESWLESERARGVLKADGGRVVHVPLAMRLTTVRSAQAAADEIEAWRVRGISAYALRQEDQAIDVLAGAFEGAAQAAVLAMRLRELGAEPRLAYRIGRSF